MSNHPTLVGMIVFLIATPNRKNLWTKHEAVLTKWKFVGLKVRTLNNPLTSYVYIFCACASISQ